MFVYMTHDFKQSVNFKITIKRQLVKVAYTELLFLKKEISKLKQKTKIISSGTRLAKTLKTSEI